MKTIDALRRAAAEGRNVLPDATDAQAAVIEAWAAAALEDADATYDKRFSYSLMQAAAVIGTTPDNLRQAIARGSLRATKRGRDWWVTMAEVGRYRAENRRG